MTNDLPCDHSPPAGTRRPVVSARALARACACATTLLLAAAPTATADSVLVTSSGKKVKCSGILRAHPDGLDVLVRRTDEKTVTVPWSKLDHLDLELNHKEIWNAYKSTQRLNKPIVLKLGAFADMKTYEELMEEMAAAFDQSYSFRVPYFGRYFAWVKDYYNLKNKDYEDLNRRKASSKDDYQRVIDEFFGGKGLDTYAYESRYHKGKEISFTARQFLDYFTGGERDSFNHVRLILKNRKEIANRPRDILRSYLHQVPNATFDPDNAAHNGIKLILKDALSAMTDVVEGRSYDKRSLRKLAKLKDVLDAAAKRR